MVFDLNGTIIKPSISFCHTTGYTTEELRNHALMDFVVSEDRISSILGFGSLLQGNQLSNFENRIQCKTGSIEWFSWIGIPFLNEEKIIAIFQVITNQKTIEKDLLDQEKKYKSIYDYLPIGIAVTDENGTILEVNEAAKELFEIEKNTKLKRSLNHKKWSIITNKGSSMLPRNFTLLQASEEKRKS
jgi:PAS domain S-box-containing protein